MAIASTSKVADLARMPKRCFASLRCAWLLIDAKPHF
jgi:hypothetical protein